MLRKGDLFSYLTYLFIYLKGGGVVRALVICHEWMQLSNVSGKRCVDSRGSEWL